MNLSGMDRDYLAFRELLAQAERNPAIAAELTRLMLAGAPLREVLALADSAECCGASGESQDFGGIRPYITASLQSNAGHVLQDAS